MEELFEFMANRRRTHRMEKLARIYDAEILPIWAERFGRILLRGIDIPAKAQILDVVCGTGYPSTEIARRMPADARLIAIDGSSAMLDVARKKLQKLGAKNIFLRTEHAEPKLSFADDVYDLVVCNLGIIEMDDAPASLRDFARVTRPGGEVRITLPVEGSFAEFYDIYREVLIKHDKPDTLRKLDEYIEETLPSVETCESWIRGAGLEDPQVVVDEFTLLFQSSREFFFAPVIEFGMLNEWKQIAGSGQEMQDVFWYIKESIDSYFDGRAFEVSVRAAVLIGRKPAEGAENVGDDTDPDVASAEPATIDEEMTDTESDDSDSSVDLDPDQVTTKG
jgi:ubiquinone/menaquinone biosynthesis C-methylase UbiE